MKYVLFLYTENDSTKARRLMDHVQGRLRKIADVRNIKSILVMDQDFREELRSSECVVLIRSPQASFLTRDKQQQNDDDFIIFDGKVMYEEFTENKELVKNRFIIIHFKEKSKNDWIPPDLDENRIFHVEDGIVPPDGSPTLAHLEYRLKKILLGDSFLYWAQEP